MRRPWRLLNEACFKFRCKGVALIHEARKSCEAAKAQLISGYSSANTDKLWSQAPDAYPCHPN